MSFIQLLVIIFVSAHLVATEDDTIQLRCDRNTNTYQRHHTAETTYLCIGGHLLEEYTSKSELSSTNFTLTINSVTVDDSGVYSCIGDSGISEIHDVQLTVATEGDLIQLHCDRTRGMQVDCTYQHVPTEDILHIDGRLFDGQLNEISHIIMLTITLHNSGLYSCVEDSGGGQTHLMKLVIVKRGSQKSSAVPAPSVTVPSNDVGVAAVVAVILSVFIFAIIIICRDRRRLQGVHEHEHEGFYQHASDDQLSEHSATSVSSHYPTTDQNHQTACCLREEERAPLTKNDDHLSERCIAFPAFWDSPTTDQGHQAAYGLREEKQALLTNADDLLSEHVRMSAPLCSPITDQDQQTRKSLSHICMSSKDLVYSRHEKTHRKSFSHSCVSSKDLVYSRQEETHRKSLSHSCVSSKDLVYSRQEETHVKRHFHSCVIPKDLVCRQFNIPQDIHSLPLELHEMILMSSLYRLTKTLFPIDPRPDPRLKTKTETRAHVIAFKKVSSVCQYFHQVITKRKWFRRQLMRQLTVACRLQPRLLQRLVTGQDHRVTGLTKLNNKLYILCSNSATIIVYNTEQRPYKQLTSIFVNGMKCPTQIAASVGGNCLYAADSIGCVWRIRADHKVDKWIDVSAAISLSVTSEGHLVILRATDVQRSTSHFEWRGRVEVYGADKLKLTSLNLPHHIVNPRHVLQAANKSFIVCHGDRNTALNRVVEVSNEGTIVRSCGGTRGSEQEQFNMPCHIAMDSAGKLFVAEVENNRILLLNKKLEIERVLLTWSPGADDVRYPVAVHCDKETLQFAVGLRSGHVEIYSL